MVVFLLTNTFVIYKYNQIFKLFYQSSYYALSFYTVVSCSIQITIYLVISVIRTRNIFCAHYFIYIYFCNNYINGNFTYEFIFKCRVIPAKEMMLSVYANIYFNKLKYKNLTFKRFKKHLKRICYNIQLGKQRIRNSCVEGIFPSNWKLYYVLFLTEG